MTRAGRTMPMILAFTWWIFNAGLPAHASQTTPPGGTPQQVEPLMIEPDTEQPVVVDFGGSTLIGGHYGGNQDGGGQGSCGSGTQAFMKVLDVNGSELWQACHHSSPSGLCEQTSGQPFFANFTSLDPAYIIASKVTAAETDADTGEIAVTGEVVVACEGPDPEMQTGAFIAIWDSNGNLRADTYIGQIPNCTPPTEPMCCQELCGDLSSAGPLDCEYGGGCGGQGVTIGGGTVAFTGWCEIPGLANGREVVVNSYTTNLTELWSFMAGTPEHDVGLDVAIAPGGDVIATGHTGHPTDRRNVFASRHDVLDGSLKSVFIGGGPLDDEGRSVEVDGNGNVFLTGYVTDQASLGPLTIGGIDQGHQNFDAVLDGTTLQPTYAQAIPMILPNLLRGPELGLPTKAIPGQPAPEPERQGQLPPEEIVSLEIIDCTITAGASGGGCADVLSKAGDGATLNLLEGLGSDDDEHLFSEVVITFQPPTIAFVLKSINLKIAADACYIATVSLKGPQNSEYITIGQRQICPLETPRLRAEVLLEDSEFLGFTTAAPPPPGKLKVKFRFDFGTYTCPNFDTQAEETSLDSLDTDVGF